MQGQQDASKQKPHPKLQQLQRLEDHWFVYDIGFCTTVMLPYTIGTGCTCTGTAVGVWLYAGGGAPATAGWAN
eukprot:CAMPEP_0172010186 /NCGR_PEP_ID=MMETSP1041-20130122/7595_1 /TAXON_ID=464988 /ORGANISM="Hemiselmis andersenii, Strain CCMP439" /LENGTH=72 /DNA_ID=CAMNT_0012664529 /DNA_START=526 /DNA_END=744 /DNA_ORIENTATION=-